MKGINQVWVSGNVGAKIVSGVTRDNDPACSFSVAVDDRNRGVTWVRVNAYGGTASYCLERLRKGCYVSVVGELMNRDGKYGELIEVRGKDIVFIDSLPRESKEIESVQESE
ncbi:MAG TPA: single-stranded DNA-binding protein [Nitrososphaera sp.]|nr:single-stranded DNA-binding protein [Nitrososphaera sp.]